MRIYTAVTLVLIVLLGAGFARSMPQAQNISESELGVILLAHGSGAEWNKAVTEALAKTGGAYKWELVFGMGNARDIQKSVDRLEASGVRAIVIVPFFLSSHSEMYRHLEYILGVPGRDEPDVLFWFLMGRHDAANGEGHSAHGSADSFFEQVRFSVPYRVASPMDYDSIIAEVLVDRLKGTTADASVFLLSHGPITAEDNAEWLADLVRYERYLSGKFPQSRFFGMTWRDDAPPFIRDRAIQKIQDALQRETAAGRRVIVVPFLLAPGGREAEIKTILQDCTTCIIIPQTLLPHPAMGRYIMKKVDQERMQMNVLR